MTYLSKRHRSNDRKTSYQNKREPHPAFLKHEVPTQGNLYQKVDDFEPKTEKQELYFDYLEASQVVVVTGEPGTGKSLLAVVHALDLLRKKKIDTIYITKPPVEVGASLGFLPGSAGQKFAPYMDSILGHVEDLVGRQEKSRLLAENKIQCMPLQFLRGANLDKCVVIADEMQNAQLVELKTLLTRLKEDSQLIMTGDLNQCDLDNGLSGFAKVIEVLRDVEGCSFVDFGIEDILRSGIVKNITIAFRKHNI